MGISPLIANYWVNLGIGELKDIQYGRKIFRPFKPKTPNFRRGFGCLMVTL